MYSKFRKITAQGMTLALIMLLLASQTVLAASNTNVASQGAAYKIIAIGDSVTAGYEHGFTEQSNPYGFAEHVYEQALFHGLRTEYANYGVLGLRTDGFKPMDAGCC